MEALALQQLGRTVIDPDLFDLFLREGVWVDYARKFLDPAQIEEVDLERIPGYSSRSSG